MRLTNLASNRLLDIVVNYKYCAIYLGGCGEGHRGYVNGPSGEARFGNRKFRGLQNTGSVPFLQFISLERAY